MHISDLKPANILIYENCNVKICDFGLSRIMSEEQERRSPFSPGSSATSSGLSSLSSSPFRYFQQHQPHQQQPLRNFGGSLSPENPSGALSCATKSMSMSPRSVHTSAARSADVDKAPVPSQESPQPPQPPQSQEEDTPPHRDEQSVPGGNGSGDKGSDQLDEMSPRVPSGMVTFTLCNGDGGDGGNTTNESRLTVQGQRHGYGEGQADGGVEDMAEEDDDAGLPLPPPIVRQMTHHVVTRW